MRASEQRALSMKRGIASRFSEDEVTRPVGTSGWRVIGLCAFYVLLSALTGCTFGCDWKATILDLAGAIMKQIADEPANQSTVFSGLPGQKAAASKSQRVRTTGHA